MNYNVQKVLAILVRDWDMELDLELVRLQEVKV
jgi:hypothetical protein